ncbi:MAG TPA: hypothetical protein EYP55_03010, partial [Anaerolineae bacterium]|nr:hypothetical protein [Anaerolineae bacterium]
MKAGRISLVVTLFTVIGLLLAACAPAPAPTPTPTKPPTPEATPTKPPVPKVGVTYKIGFAPAVTGGGSFLGEPERNVAE